MSQQLKQRLADPLLVTKSLIGANLIVFVLQVMHGASLGGFFGGGLRYTRFDLDYALLGRGVAAGEWYRIVTSGFMHFGVMHILFNMLILFRLGQDMEAGIGRARFATLYFVSLVAGSFGALLLSPDALSAGASGAVFGLATAATIGLYQRGVKFYNTGWGPLLAINLFITFTFPDISVGAHLGGVVAGGLVGYVMLKPRASGSNRAAGFVLAAIIAVISIVGSIAVSHEKYGTCSHNLSQPCSKDF